MKHTTLLLRHLTLLALIATTPFAGLWWQRRSRCTTTLHRVALLHCTARMVSGYCSSTEPESITATPLKAKKAGVLKSKPSRAIRSTFPPPQRQRSAPPALLPRHSLNAKVVARDTLLQMEGLRHPEVLTQWYQLLCTAPEEEFPGQYDGATTRTQQHPSSPLPSPWPTITYPTPPALPSSANYSPPPPTSYNSSQGYSPPNFPANGTTSPTTYNFTAERTPSCPPLSYIPSPYMVLAFEDGRHPSPDSLFLRRLDSLKVPLYQAHLFSDTLSSGHKGGRAPQATTGVALLLVDSVGKPQARHRCRYQCPPSYMIADSTRLVWREWHHRDSLLHFLEQL